MFYVEKSHLTEIISPDYSHNVKDFRVIWHRPLN